MVFSIPVFTFSTLSNSMLHLSLVTDIKSNMNEPSTMFNLSFHSFIFEFSLLAFYDILYVRGVIVLSALNLLAVEPQTGVHTKCGNKDHNNQELTDCTSKKKIFAWWYLSGQEKLVNCVLCLIFTVMPCLITQNVTLNSPYC